MKAFQKKFVAMTAVAGLAVLGAACESSTEVESPGVEEPADDVVVEEGADAEAEADAGADAEMTEDTATEESTEG